MSYRWKVPETVITATCKRVFRPNLKDKPLFVEIG